MAEAKKKAPITYYLGTGRRKTSVARVRIAEGKGNISINDRALLDFFTEEKDREAVLGPLKVTEQLSRLDVIVRVTGGGITGQADAIKQGLARAIKTMFSPTEERKATTTNHVTVVRAFKEQKKEAPGATPATPAPAEAEDTATGMVKRLRDGGFLTRDSRMKERKKYGLRGARRGTQFSKR